MPDQADELAHAIETGAHVQEDGMIHPCPEYVYMLGPRFPTIEASVGGHVHIDQWQFGTGWVTEPWPGAASESNRGDA